MPLPGPLVGSGVTVYGSPVDSTEPPGLSTLISSNRHQPEQVPVTVTYWPDTDDIGSVIVPAVSTASAPAGTGCELRRAWPEVPAGAQLWPVIPVYWGGQSPAAALPSSGQLIPAVWSAWVTSTTEPTVAAWPRLIVTWNGPLSAFQPMTPLQFQVPDGDTWPSVSLPAPQPAQVDGESAYWPAWTTRAADALIAPKLPLAIIGGSSWPPTTRSTVGQGLPLSRLMVIVAPVTLSSPLPVAGIGTRTES